MGRSANSSPGGERPSAVGAPGSNGFWRRKMWQKPGTYTWTAPKSGKVKVQAIGAGAGGVEQYPGASGGYGEKTFDVVEGATLTIVIGAGSASNSATPPGAGTAGSTSISGGGLASALVIAGAVGKTTATSTDYGSVGTISGPWDRSFPGAVATAQQQGSPASASPWGPGAPGLGQGGPGWSGAPTVSTIAGGGTHGHGVGSLGGPGLTAPQSSSQDASGKSRPFWDLEDADSSGASVEVVVVGTGQQSYSASAGIGAGGSYGGNNSTGISALGGGSAAFNNAPKSGNGAGGAAAVSASIRGGNGGDGFVALFWDEVA